MKHPRVSKLGLRIATSLTHLFSAPDRPIFSDPARLSCVYRVCDHVRSVLAVSKAPTRIGTEDDKTSSAASGRWAENSVGEAKGSRLGSKGDGEDVYKEEGERLVDKGEVVSDMMSVFVFVFVSGV